MHTTLDHLEQSIKQQSGSAVRRFLKEVRIFALFVAIVYVVGNVAVNAQLYQNAVKETLSGRTGQENTSSESMKSKLFESGHKETNKKFMTTKNQNDELIQSIEMLGSTSENDFIGAESLNRSLEENLGSYDFEFNTLSPSDRIIIPKININAPLQQSSFTKHINNITTDDFDKDLYHGVVQYPTTPHAGQKGNTLVFGHTSYESWKGNPYATIFSQMTKLENGDIIEVIQDGKLHKYRVFEKTIINPSQVNEEYLKHQDGDYISLLGCYPIGSDAQRILVVGELIS